MAGRARALKDKLPVGAGVAQTLAGSVQGSAPQAPTAPGGGLGATGLTEATGSNDGSQKGFGGKRAEAGVNIGQLRAQAGDKGSIIEPYTIGPGVEGDQVGARGERRAPLVGNSDQALKKFR